ncbi:MAG: hypothetical protein KAX37_11020, partial [Opitutaceae bacterium]|nr:hypothetical protein [Opitutaceae bacterium]
HLAWQAITDRQLTRDPAFADALHRICRDPAQSAPRRIQALWALTGSGSAGPDTPQALFTSENRNLRREAVRASTAENGWSLSKFTRVYARAATDPDPEVRAEVIRQLGAHMSKSHPSENGLRLLFSFAQPPLPGPLARSTSRPNTWIKTGDAYDREFERYLVCSFLETHRAETSAYLDSTESRHLSVEARLLGALALEPRQGVLLVAAIIPTLSRPPEAEELFRVAQFADDPATARALVALLEKEESRSAALEAILTYRTQLTSRQLPALLAPFVEPLLRSQSVMELDLGLRLTSGFKITEAEPAVIALIQAQRNIIARTPLPPSSGNSLSSTDSKLHSPEERLLAGIRTLSELGTTHLDLYKQLISTSSQPAVRYEAAVALAGSKDARAASLVLSLWSHLSTPQRRASLDRLLTDESGATAVIAAVTSGTVSIDDLDGVKIERLRALLPANPEAISLDERMNSASRLVLAMDGTDAAQSELGLTLRGAFTAETWMRLEPGDRAIGASDGWIGAPGQAEIHFADSRVRIRLFEPERDVLSSTRSIAPEVWTHLAVTRNDQGLWSLYIDGQLDTQSRAAEPGPLEAIRLGWTSAPGGPKGYFSDLRFWSVCRSDSEIASTFDRQVPNTSAGLILAAQDKATWGKCRQGATLVKTTQVPPVLSIEDSAKLDAKFARFRTLAEKDGDPARGRSLAGICLACHVIGTEGGIIGPNLSGAGSMGLEGLLRSLLTPNAAMESAYQIFRVEMKEGGIFEGFLAQEDSRAIVLRTPGAEDQRIPREKVRNAHYVRRSLMPEGLLEALPPEQVSDLFAYLRALK